MKTSLLSLTALLAGTVLVLAQAEAGKPAPPFGGKDLEGKTHTLADYKGKIVVLEAYNLDCPFCANHYKTGAMQALQAYATGKGVVWLVINSTHAAHPSYRKPEVAQREFADQRMKATAWIEDSTGQIGKAYGLRTTPHLVIIDAQGLIAYNGAIDDKADTSHDPRSARNYVRDALDKLLAGEKPAVSTTKPYGCGVKYAE